MGTSNKELTSLLVLDVILLWELWFVSAHYLAALRYVLIPQADLAAEGPVGDQEMIGQWLDQFVLVARDRIFPA